VSQVERKGSLRRTGPESPGSRWSYTHDENHPSTKDIYTIDVTGSANVREQSDNERRASQPGHQEDSNNHEPLVTAVRQMSSHNEDSPSATADAVTAHPRRHEAAGVAFLLEEGGQNIVAEPDSYISDPEPERRGNYSRRQSTALTLSGKQEGTTGIEHLSRRIRPSHTMSRNTSSLLQVPFALSPPLRRPLQRPSTFTEYHIDTNVRAPRTIKSRRAGLSDNHRSAARRRGTVDSDPKFQGRYRTLAFAKALTLSH
jgi:hypothetical protein